MSVSSGTIAVTEGSGKTLDTVVVNTDKHREVVAIGSPDAATATRYLLPTAAGAMPVDDGGGSLTVDGAVSVSASALPSGAATEATLAAVETLLEGTLSVSVVSSPGTGLTNAQLRATPVPVDASGSTVPVSMAAPPTGGATGAKQDTGNASLTSIDTKTPALSGGKVPVTDPTALPLPSGAATAAKQPALGAAGTPSSDVITIQGKASMTPVLVDGSGVTQPVSITGNQAVNNAQVSGTAIDVNSGNKSAGTMRVVLATDQPALTNKLLVTPDSVALPANQSVNVNQINSVTPLMGNGVTGTGSPRVTLASDTTAPTNAWPVTPKPGSTGGTLVASGSIQATATSIKASAANLFGIDVFNSNTSPVYLQIWNTLVGSVTVGTTAPVMSIGIPAGAALERDFSNGIAFGTALVIAFTTTRSGAGAPANSVDYNVEYV